MKLLEIIDAIYPKIIEKLDLSQDDQQFEVCEKLNEKHTYFIIVLFDVDLRPSIYINEIEIKDENEKDLDCNIKKVETILEQKLNLYYDYQKSISHEQEA